MKKVFSIVFIFLLFNIPARSKLADSTVSHISLKKHLKVGEDLTYVVKYAFLNLGEIRFKIVSKDTIDGITVYKTVAYIDSYEGLPFVTIHQVYESFIDSTFFPLVFIGTMLDDDTTYTKYCFKSNSSIHVVKGNVNTHKINVDSTVLVRKRFQDGLSILFYARMKAGKDTTLLVSCFVNEKKEIATLNYYSEREEIEIDAADYEIDCLKLDGSTNFVSVYGFTGEFEGWFSNDAYSIPVKAKMHVLIGNVTLELIHWKINNWNPPEYKD